MIAATRRGAGEIAAAVVVAAVLLGIAQWSWFAWPRPGGAGRLIAGLAAAGCLYRLIQTGDGRRNLALRTATWLTPLLLLQAVMQAVVWAGWSTLD
ncbi:hypothetical protein [Sphingomonas bacterium]|uniref:hypothetical protein n=1 Tax=Sphingomonas bacterium TaxID=1895847 RepID=UPI0015761439|nr:hypothetical protein [Sphingomonas bacterium]